MSDTKSGVKKTLVEEGTELKGSLTSKCPIEVKGRIEGDLTAPSLTVSATGAVHGTVKVGELTSEGELAGEFDADVVHLSGTVKDNTVIRAKSLEVKLAPVGAKMQVIFGECSLDVGDMPVQGASVHPAAAKSEAPKGKSEMPAVAKSVAPAKSEAPAARADEDAPKAERRSVPPKMGSMPPPPPNGIA